MDYEKIIAEKDSEISMLRKELETLRAKLNELDLEEIELPNEVSDENDSIVLKLPVNEEEGETEPSSQQEMFMQFLNALIQQQPQFSKEDEEEPSETDEVEPSENDEVEPSENDEVEPSETDEVEPSENDEVEPSENDEEEQ